MHWINFQQAEQFLHTIFKTFYLPNIALIQLV